MPAESNLKRLRLAEEAYEAWNACMWEAHRRRSDAPREDGKGSGTAWRMHLLVHSRKTEGRKTSQEKYDPD